MPSSRPWVVATKLASWRAFMKKQARAGRRPWAHGDVARAGVRQDSRIRGGGRLHSPDRDARLPATLTDATRVADFDERARGAHTGRRLDQHAARHARRLAIRRWRPARTCSSRSRWRDRREPSRSSTRRSARSESWSIGYILRHHPSWTKFVEIARQLGTPLVFRMNLNQQSSGETVGLAQAPADSFSPIVDCGVHYVDIMCQMTPARPVARPRASARSLTDEVPTCTTTACCR